MNHPDLPPSVYSGVWNTGHVQGVAVEPKGGHVYFSFTDTLVKTDLSGQVVGSVTGLVGHLGCLALSPRDGRVYASLEYKADAIGSAIAAGHGQPPPREDGFYIAIFDVDQIHQPGMDATKDGVMNCVHLEEVLNDYQAQWVDEAGFEHRHRYGCSGIDGITFGPAFGAASTADYLYVAYGIYGDIERTDNDYQVLLRYDTSGWKAYERPLEQHRLHRSGPGAPDEKLFAYTGNTNYGIQNLEYDSYTNRFLAAVYPGRKPTFPNYSLFAFDAARPPERQPLEGTDETGLTVSLLKQGLCDTVSGVYGWESELGSTGLVSLGDGTFYLSRPGREEGGQSSLLERYRWTGCLPCPFQLIENGVDCQNGLKPV